MIPWQFIEDTPLPGESTPLQLFRRGEEYVIRVDGNELMSSRVFGSEKALATLAIERVKNLNAKTLIGGLGMGFTLTAALQALGDDAKVDVVELVPGVVKWNRGVLSSLAGDPLNDPRVSVHVGDVRKFLMKPPGKYNVILLDVDNGPDGLTRATNGWLYQKAGLTASFQALNPGGVLGVWSAFKDPKFTHRLRSIGFEVEELPVRANGKKGARHTLWYARRPAACSGGRAPFGRG